MYYILVGDGGVGLLVAGVTVVAVVALAGVTVAVVVCILLDDWASVNVAEAVVEKVDFGQVLNTFQF